MEMAPRRHRVSALFHKLDSIITACRRQVQELEVEITDGIAQLSKDNLRHRKLMGVNNGLFPSGSETSDYTTAGHNGNDGQG